MKELLLHGSPTGAWVLTDSTDHLTWHSRTCNGAIRMSPDGMFIVSRLPGSEPLFYEETFKLAMVRLNTLAVIAMMDTSGEITKHLKEVADEKNNGGNIRAK